MVRNCLHFALSFLLFAFSLPLLAVSFLIAALCAAVVAIPRVLIKRKDPDAITLENLRTVDQFNFEEGMSAYEELIGAHVRRQR